MHEHTQVPLRVLLLRIGLRFLLIVALILFLTLFLMPLLKLFLPFLLAFLTATILAPLVEKISKRVGKVWNFWSMLFIILLILAVTAVLVSAGYYLFQQITSLADSWESILDNVILVLRRISDFLETNVHLPGTDLENYAVNSLDSLVNWVTEELSNWAPSLVSGVGNIASGIASFLIALLFFIVGAYFMTSDYLRLRGILREHVPTIIQPQMRHIKDAMGSAMFGYLKAQLILSGIVTLIIFLALLLQGQNYALIIALLCGIIDLVPFFGSGTVLVPWGVVELFLGNYRDSIFLLILAFGLFLFRKLAEPKVVGNQTGLPPLLSLISIYVGMRLNGVVGMILLPIACMILISLYSAGFFDPTISDFRMLFHRILQLARIDAQPEEPAEETLPEPGENPEENTEK